MGLLRRALIYREEFQNKQGEKIGNGLLNKTLSYLGFDRVKKINDNDKEVQDQVNGEPTKSQGIAFDRILHYYNIINDISNDLSKIIFDDDILKNINAIIASYYKISKNVLFVFSPLKQSFIYWDGINIDNSDLDKISFDLRFLDIYKKIIKNSYLLSLPGDSFYEEFRTVLPESDVAESDFQLFVPFIFCGRVIAIFLGLQMSDRGLPDKDLINSFEIIGKLNGALLYNIFQQENFV